MEWGAEGNGWKLGGAEEVVGRGADWEMDQVDRGCVYVGGCRR